jgi:hypothetical protein
MKAKEFWIYDAGDNRDHFRYSEPTGVMSAAGYTHVREVLPDTVTITREELERAINASTHQSRQETIYYVTRELFGIAPDAKTGD